MPETPLSPYTVYSSVTTTASTAPLSGYAVTLRSDGAAKGTTAIISGSLTQSVDGIALAAPSYAGAVIQIQIGGRIDKSYVPTIGSGTAGERVVIDSNGAPKRLSAASGTVIGTATADGHLDMSLAASGAAYYQTVQGLGTDKTQRSKLNFATDLIATDDSTNNRTTITMSWARHFMLAGSY